MRDVNTTGSNRSRLLQKNPCHSPSTIILPLSPCGSVSSRAVANANKRDRVRHNQISDCESQQVTQIRLDLQNEFKHLVTKRKSGFATLLRHFIGSAAAQKRRSGHALGNNESMKGIVQSQLIA